MPKPIQTNFLPQVPKPLDDRLSKATFADLNGIPVKYNHMVVHVEDTDKDWKWYESTESWVDVTGGSASGGVWGFISGVITDQTDLINYLVANYSPLGHTHAQLPPLAHTHVEVDITNLDKYTQAEVDALVAYKSGLTTGILDGGDLSINVDTTKFDVAAGSFIYQEFAVANPYVEPIMHEVAFTAYTAITPTYLATHPATYLGLTYTPLTSTITLVQASAPFSAITRRDVAPLGVIYHGDNTNVDRVVPYKTTPINSTNQLQDLMEALGPLKLSGAVLSPNGINLTIDRSVGSLFQMGSNFDNSAKNPHTITISAGVAFNFTYTMQNSVESLESPNVDPDFYDNAGVLTAVTTDYWTVQRFYLFADGYVRAQYGQNLYDSKDAAVSVVDSENFTVEQANSAKGALIAYLVVQEGATDLSDLAQAEFFEVTKFGWLKQRLQNIDSDKSYVHVQSVASASWVIPHGLGKYPAIEVKDGSGNTVIGSIDKASTATSTITYNTAFTGTAYCN